MTAILAVIAEDERPTDEALVTRMLGRMGARGGAHAGVWREGGAVLAVCRQPWELGPGFSGPVLVLQEGELVVAADASLYYRDDLRRKLAAKGVRATGDTPSQLILAAYRAWGERCAEELEGDFAFILWDRVARRLVAARDHMGRRPLFYSERGAMVIVASAIGAILSHPAVVEDLNLPAIAESMAGYVSAGGATSYKAISRLHAARTLVADRGHASRTRAHWTPPTFQTGTALNFDDAAERLRELLCAATTERMAPSDGTSVWMSGGRDSTAVFAAGQLALRERSLDPTSLRPVSLSYPEGDVGREDETINAVAAHWNASVHWLDLRDVPKLGDTMRRTAHRDEPFTHVFESIQRALASTSRMAGTHVGLDGIGGDQLFLLSSIHLADLFRTGRWLTLRREWLASGLSGGGLAALFTWAVQPGLPTSVLIGTRRLRRGRPLKAWLRRRVPQWTQPAFAREHALVEYERVLAPRRRGETIASTESCWYLTDPFFSTIFGLGSEYALEEGVELRSPLYDRRLIEFAATRPRTDHVGDSDGKRLLRHSMRGLLPTAVVASRTHRTGAPADYTAAAMREILGNPFEELFASSALADLGMVDLAALRRSRETVLRSGSPDLVLPLLLTMHAELWLRARCGANASPAHQRPNGALTLPVLRPTADAALVGAR